MTNKFIPILFTFIFMLSLSAQRANKERMKHQMPTVEKELAKISSELKLSEAQATKILPILKKYRALAKTQHERRRDERKEQREELRKENKKNRVQMMKIKSEELGIHLSKEQKESYKKFLEREQKKREDRRKEMREKHREGKKNKHDKRKRF